MTEHVETIETGEKSDRRRLPNKKGALKLLVLRLRTAAIRWRIAYLRTVVKMDIAPDVQLSFKAHLDLTNPRGIYVSDGTLVAFGAVILSHDMARALSTDTYIGRNCFVGAHSIILPGVRIGDGCIIASGAVVTRDVPPKCLVAGNPARVLRTDIETQKYGVLKEAYWAAVDLQAADDARAAAGAREVGS